MFDYQHTYSSGFRDVIAAWLVCLAVAATGFAYASATATEDPGVEVRTVPHAAPPLPMRAICADRNYPVENHLVDS
jgi:hypothetical protein